MAELRYHFEPGEVRFVWLDEDGDRTSPYHKTISAAYAYRAVLLRFLSGERVWKRGAKFEPHGSGKAPQRLGKLVMAMQEAEMTEEEQLDVAAADRLARPQVAS